MLAPCRCCRSSVQVVASCSEGLRLFVEAAAEAVERGLSWCRGVEGGKCDTKNSRNAYLYYGLLCTASYRKDRLTRLLLPGETTPMWIERVQRRVQL